MPFEQLANRKEKKNLIEKFTQRIIFAKQTKRYKIKIKRRFYGPSTKQANSRKEKKTKEKSSKK